MGGHLLLTWVTCPWLNFNHKVWKLKPIEERRLGIFWLLIQHLKLEYPRSCVVPNDIQHLDWMSFGTTHDLEGHMSSEVIQIRYFYLALEGHDHLFFISVLTSLKASPTKLTSLGFLLLWFWWQKITLGSIVIFVITCILLWVY